MADSFGLWLDNQIQKLGTNKTGLAHMLGLTQSCVSQWVSGATRPSDRNCRKLARVLHVSLGDIHHALGRLPHDESEWPEPIREIANLLRDVSDDSVEVVRAVARVIAEREAAYRTGANSEAGGDESD